MLINLLFFFSGSHLALLANALAFCCVHWHFFLLLIINWLATPPPLLEFLYASVHSLRLFFFWDDPQSCWSIGDLDCSPSSTVNYSSYYTIPSSNYLYWFWGCFHAPCSIPRDYETRVTLLMRSTCLNFVLLSFFELPASPCLGLPFSPCLQIYRVKFKLYSTKQSACLSFIHWPLVAGFPWPSAQTPIEFYNFINKLGQWLWNLSTIVINIITCNLHALKLDLTMVRSSELVIHAVLLANIDSCFQLYWKTTDVAPLHSSTS